MLYIYAEDQSLKVIVLETANLEELKKGRPAYTSDKSVCIAWTPDISWLASEISKTNGDASKIAELIDAATKRPENPTSGKGSFVFEKGKPNEPK